MESSKEKRMVISLILFRCAKHSILPRKTGTWEKRIPSSYGQNSTAQSHKSNTYNNSFFFTIVFLQFSIKFCFSGCLVLITNSKLVISVGKRRGFSRSIWFLIRELFPHKKIFFIWSLYLDENHSLLDNHLIPIQDLNTNFLLEPKNRKPEI